MTKCARSVKKYIMWSLISFLAPISCEVVWLFFCSKSEFWSVKFPETQGRKPSTDLWETTWNWDCLDVSLRAQRSLFWAVSHRSVLFISSSKRTQHNPWNKVFRGGKVSFWTWYNFFSGFNHLHTLHYSRFYKVKCSPSKFLIHRKVLITRLNFCWIKSAMWFFR